MKARILVYSPDIELRGAFTEWSRQADIGEVQIVDQPEALLDAISNGDQNAVILDDSDGALPLTALTHDLALQLPQARLLAFPPTAVTDPSEIKDAILHGYLSKPFSAEELTTALRGLQTIESTELDAATKTRLPTIQPPAVIPIVSNDQNPELLTQALEGNKADTDLSFLKGWLFEESEESNTTPALQIAAGTEPDDPKEITDLSVEAFEIIETTPVEINTPLSETDVLPQDAIAPIDTETATIVASITPSDLLTLKRSLPQAPESGFVTEEVAHLSGDLIPPVNIHSLRLHYSCVLIPRDPQHYLARDLAERLGLVLPQIHLKHGWRVTGMSIRPQYMQWSVALPLDVSPVEAVSEIRQKTSSCIQANHPGLKSSESEGFWAPGYLIMSGNLAPPTSIIREFLVRTRNVRFSES